MTPWLVLWLGNVVTSIGAETETVADILPPEIGLFLAEAPPVAPGSVAHVPQGDLSEGVAAWKAGDTQRATLALEAWLAGDSGPWGRQRTAGRFLLGWIHLQEGRHNLASAQFTRVRLHKESPLSPYGAWYEALTDHLRGRHSVAAGECSAYRKKYPEGPHYDDCTMLMGDAYSAAGSRASAISAYSTWLADNPKHPRKEEAQLGIALAEMNGRPKLAAARLQALLLDHSWATTGVAAQAALTELADLGFYPPTLDAIEVELRRATTLKNCGDRTEAWDAYRHLRDDHGDSARVAQWARANRENFARKTRHFGVLAAGYEASYNHKPNAETAWKAFRYHFRAGNFDKAGKWGDLGVEKHSSSHRFRYNRDQIAQAWQLAGDYDKATRHWDVAARAGGQSGRLASFYAAFTRWRDRDWDSALARLDSIVEGGGSHVLEATYYRGRTKASLKDWAGHRRDFNAVADDDKRGWYRTLVAALRRSWRQTPPVAELLRIGRWPGTLLSGPPKTPESSMAAQVTPAMLASALSPVPTRKVAWDAMAWPLAPSAIRTELPPEPSLALPRRPDIPESAPVGRWYNPSQARSAFVELVEDGEDLWPELPAMLDFADVGLFDLTAPYMATVFAEWDKARRRRIWGRRGEDLRAVKRDNSDWRQIFLHAQDPYGLARKSAGLERSASNPEEAREARRQSWPTAYRRHVVSWSRTYDVDPMLIWGLMRQESLYRSHALSSVGAVGVMQVMPMTGARIARDLGDWGYTPARLEQPSVNVQYGTWYLSQLLDRFDGVWPIAVAAYNAGPVNASAWVQPQGDRIGIDAWTEQIPLSETRNYVKRVGGNYATYVQLYGTDDRQLDVPLRPAGDDSEVIDY
jgi:soluble lytic murein transglycosylase-like protein